MEKITKLYHIMLEEMGPQYWWPAETKKEIILGAILVQNTNWNNADQALITLKEQTDFSSDEILNLENSELETLIRPSGFYRNKTKTIQTVFEWFNQHNWDYEKIKETYGTELRKELLALHGIGEETADVFLVYVFDQVEFIADKYARKLFNQLEFTNSIETYHGLKSKVELPSNFTYVDAQEFHGLIDEFGKMYLKNREASKKVFYLTIKKRI